MSELNGCPPRSVKAVTIPARTMSPFIYASRFRAPKHPRSRRLRAALAPALEALGTRWPPRMIQVCFPGSHLAGQAGVGRRI